ncbi:putative oxidoreductase C26H5.09c [Hypsizygus marmoreus]|uniref:Oxidoreductase C26H5.09c n=1 Tax=Hypsizygus marmoreus TaxID=39966 RepID=A0A369J775_HYPMA|nr:putative oxidoreductase C26H5.09c [Hypsizygus marmoreus]
MLSGIAILGAGIFAKEGHLPALADLGEAAPNLKAVYSRSEKNAHEFADAAAAALNGTTPAIYHDGDKANDLDALLARSDIAAVIVALPITLQPSFVLKALAAGKHVLSEKPVAPDVAQGLELIKTYNSQYKSKGLVWRIAENFEAEPGFRAAAAAIAEGKIGRVIFFRTVVYNYIDEDSKWYKTPWRTVPDVRQSFSSIPICIENTFQTTQLDGEFPQHTIAALRVMLPHQLTHLSGFASLNKDFLGPHDTINVVARAGSHFHGTAEITFASPTKSRPVADGFVITGTDGWLSVNQVGAERFRGPIFRVTIKSVVKKEGKPDEEVEEVIEEPVKGIQAELASFFIAAEVASFFNAVKGKSDGTDLGDPLSALRDVAFIEAALNSDGRLVDLAELVPASLS